MKKKTIALLVVVVLLLLNVSAYAANVSFVSFLDMRKKIFDESKAIKAELTSSKDMVLINSLWDSCVITIGQLDAYFSMLGIFNTIKKGALSGDAVDYLINWLKRIKDNNTLNITSLNAVTMKIEAKTKLHIDKLTNYFVDLNKRIDQEIVKLTLVKDSVGPQNIKQK
jgi:hypothetical protein